VGLTRDGARRRRAPAFHALTVADVEPLCPDAVAVTFDVPDQLSTDFTFTPGQSITLRRVVDGEEHRRSFSLCGAVGRPPRIGVREIPGGLFSRWLVHDVRPGDRVDVQTPTGGFGARSGEEGRHLCIAAGSGITPILAIARGILSGTPTGRVALIYGNRTTTSVMFSEELGDLKNRYGPRLHLVHVLSREPRDVELFSGRLDAERLRRLLAEVVPVVGVRHAWLCGPLAMVEDAREVLAELGMPADRVHFELFHVDDPPPEIRRAEQVVDGPTSEVTVVLDGHRATTAMPRSMPILDAALAVRPDLPFACKGGVCGTCRALLREGRVEMRRNYALEPRELEQGFVLTCQSRPVTDRVTVDYDS
jgi:ring-1,2-phenylacetyl-CoA epoxidase subunit PaaE